MTPVRSPLPALLAILIAAAAAPGVMAQTGPDRPMMSRPAPDFFLGRPRASVGVRGGWWRARATSDWYGFVTDQLTLERRDFSAPFLGVDAAILLTSRLDVLVSVDASRSRAFSEYRRLVDNDRLPIEQDTRLTQVTLGGGLRLALVPRGRRISRLAWVPARVVPYVGATAGVTRFLLDQTGDFVDVADSSVFSDSFRADGWAPSAQVLAGVDVQVYRHLFLTFDGRYHWASADLGRTWVGFAPLDLAGARLSTGFQVTF